MPILTYHDGQGYVEANEDDPYPVRVRQGPSVQVAGHGQVSVATTATLIRDSNPQRTSILITQITGAQQVWIGTTDDVLSTTGQLLPAAVGASITIEAHNQIWGIASTAAQTVGFWEEEYED